MDAEELGMECILVGIAEYERFKRAELTQEDAKRLGAVAIRCAEALSFNTLDDRRATQELIYDCQNAIWWLLSRVAVATTEPEGQ